MTLLTDTLPHGAGRTAGPGGLKIVPARHPGRAIGTVFGLVVIEGKSPSFRRLLKGCFETGFAFGAAERELEAAGGHGGGVTIRDEIRTDYDCRMRGPEG